MVAGPAGQRPKDDGPAVQGGQGVAVELRQRHKVVSLEQAAPGPRPRPRRTLASTAPTGSRPGTALAGSWPPCRGPGPPRCRPRGGGRARGRYRRWPATVTSTATCSPSKTRVALRWTPTCMASAWRPRHVLSTTRRGSGDGDELRPSGHHGQRQTGQSYAATIAVRAARSSI